MIEQLAASETSPEQSPIDKALEEIVEKTERGRKDLWKTNNTDNEEHNTGKVAAQEVWLSMYERNLLNFSINKQTEL